MTLEVVNALGDKAGRIGVTGHEKEAATDLLRTLIGKAAEYRIDVGMSDVPGAAVEPEGRAAPTRPVASAGSAPVHLRGTLHSPNL